MKHINRLRFWRKPPKRQTIYILVISYDGVNEQVFVSPDQDRVLDKLNRWLPELRANRVQLQDYGYKRAVVAEGGIRTYEIFEWLL